jgi:membrane protein implicated in regulation of membrane protease activity
MRALFLTAFIAGLAFSVYVMIRGVERAPRRAGPATDGLGRPLTPARTVLSPPLVAAFLIFFGVIGYVLVRATAMAALWVILVAAAGGAAAATAAVTLITQWLIPASKDDEVDERYLLQGHLARITSDIVPAGTGEIAYEVEGVRHTAPASSVDGSPIAADAEVVIERFEDGRAIVERWGDVEQRL